MTPLPSYPPVSRDRLERLLIDTARAANANRDRNPLIDEVLARTAALCNQLLGEQEEAAHEGSDRV